MQNDVSPARKLLPELDGVEYRETSLAITNDRLGEAEWKELVKGLTAQAGQTSWYIGDAILFGKRYGEMYRWAEDVTGLTESTLQKHAWLARAVPPELRVPSLAWSAHKHLCEKVHDPARRAAWLEKARKHEMTGADLRALLNIHAAPKPDHSATVGEDEHQYKCPCPCGHEWSGPPRDAPYIPLAAVEAVAA